MKTSLAILGVILLLILALGATSSLLVDSAGPLGGGGTTTTVTTTTVAVTTTTATVTTSTSAPTASTDPITNPDGSLTLSNGVILYPDKIYLPSSTSKLAEYYDGTCEISDGNPSDQIYLGGDARTVNGEETVMLCFDFNHLEVGKKYAIVFSTYDSKAGIENPLYCCFGKTGDYVHNEYTEFSLDVSGDLYATFVFTAQSDQFLLGLLYFEELPSSSTLKVYSDALKSSCFIELLEITS